MSTYIQTIYKEKNGTIQIFGWARASVHRKSNPTLASRNRDLEKKIKDGNTSDALVNNLYKTRYENNVLGYQKV